MNRKISFSAKVWLYPGTSAAWHFISLPKKEAEQVKRNEAARLRQGSGEVRRGWGAVGVRVTILRPGSGRVGPTSPRLRRASKTTWETSMFPDKKSGTYILPLKASVRKKEVIMRGDEVNLYLEYQ